MYTVLSRIVTGKKLRGIRSAEYVLHTGRTKNVSKIGVCKTKSQENLGELDVDVDEDELDFGET
jgi:hypothetical protein